MNNIVKLLTLLSLSLFGFSCSPEADNPEENLFRENFKNTVFTGVESRVPDGVVVQRDVGNIKQPMDRSIDVQINENIRKIGIIQKGFLV
jgi:hypothetical protein